VKLGTRDLHIIPPSIHEFRQNRRLEGRSFLPEVNEVTFRCVSLNHIGNLKVINALVNSVYYVTEHSICSVLTIRIC
jgi:hypothetical protein